MQAVILIQPSQSTQTLLLELFRVHEEKRPNNLKSQFLHAPSLVKHRAAGSGYAHSAVPTVQHGARHCVCSRTARHRTRPQGHCSPSRAARAMWRSLASLPCQVTWTTMGKLVGCALGLLRGGAGTPGPSRAHPWSGDTAHAVTPGLLAGRAVPGLLHRCQGPRDAPYSPSQPLEGTRRPCQRGVAH